MAKRGPKIIEIDWDEFDKLCYMQCTASEIAAWFECSVDTIERRVQEKHNVKFAEYYAEKKEKGKISLRRAQFQAATVKGNTSLMIWLGKQYLGQSDKLEQKIEDNKVDKNYDVLLEEIKKMLQDQPS